jgi:hypothetical protein
MAAGTFQGIGTPRIALGEPKFAHRLEPNEDTLYHASASTESI